MPPGLVPLVVAAAGALAGVVGIVALVNGRAAGAVIALGGALLLVWSLVRRRA